MKEMLDRPERSDLHYLAQQSRSIYLSQLSMLFLFVLCALLVLAFMESSKRPRHIAVIDTSTGKAFGTVTRQYTTDLLSMNLIYYSRLFCEEFYDANHISIQGSRKAAVEQMHPTLVQKLGITEDFYKDSYVKNIKANLATCTFDWITPPKVTVSSDPRYTVFCQFRRSIQKEGKIYESKHNVILNWIRYSDIDPMKKPSPIYVLDFSDNDINSQEVKQQLELLTQ